MSSFQPRQDSIIDQRGIRQENCDGKEPSSCLKRSRIREGAHDSLAACKRNQRKDGKTELKGEDNLVQYQEPADTLVAGNHGDCGRRSYRQKPRQQSSHPWTNVNMEETLHYDLAR